MTPPNKNIVKNGENKRISLSECEETARKLISDTEEKEKVHNITHEGEPLLDKEQEEYYRQALQSLNENGVKYSIGAAFARNAYTNIWRPTKDIDVFLKAEDLKKAMDVLNQAGFKSEVLEQHWLAKAWKGSYFIDLIFGTGHNQIQVDDDILAGGKDYELFGVPVKLIAVEELIAAAAYIKERKRNDYPDSVHLILATQGKLDWQRILNRLDGHCELLLIDLLLFDFIYPGHPDYLPQEVMQELFDHVKQRWQNPVQNPKAFRGTLLDPFSYVVDIEDWGYQDERMIKPLVNAQGEAI